MKIQNRFSAIVLLVFLLPILPVLHAQNQPQTVLAKLTDASVYLRGATLTHSASVQLRNGAQTVVVKGLSPEIETASLKVSVSGNNILSSAEFSNDYITDNTESSRIRKLRDSVKYYQRQLQEVNNDLSVDNKLLKTLSDAVSNNTQQKEKIMTPAEIAANMELYKSKAPALQKSINDNKELQAKLNGQLLRILQLQPPVGKRMSAADYLRGHPVRQN